MATYFEIVCSVLDDIYDEILETDRDAKLKACLNELGNSYSGVLKTGGPSYESALTRFAYVFRYTTAHAEYLNNIIGISPDLRHALGETKVKITCIGGGPGSDVLGFVKYLLNQKQAPHVYYYILDKESRWADTWSELDEKITEEFKSSRLPLEVDVTDCASYAKHSKPYAADIFTMIYFLSEIYKYKEKVDKFLAYCFSKLKSGALLVVIDFQDSNLSQWIDSAAKTGGLATEEAADNYNMKMDPSEEKSVLSKYIAKFGSPKLQAKIFFRIYKKP